MSKQVVYRGGVLGKGSDALELYNLMQAASGEKRNELQKKLDLHMRELDQKYLKMHGVPARNGAWRVGDKPVDE